MFEKIFGSKKEKNSTTNSAPVAEPKNPLPDPATEALFRAIAEKKKEDPLIGVKIGSQEIFNRLLNAMKNDKGVHIESLLGVLGSLGGYSCQITARANGGSGIMTVTGNDGKTYFIGDAINKPLLEDQYSFWGLAGGGAQEAGATELIDIHELVKHVATSLGSESFGVPRLPEQHRLPDLPINFVKSLWPKILPIAKPFCSKPQELPILFGLATQKAIIAGKGVIAPAIALKLVMECAIPMSKINPAEIPKV